MLTKTLSTVLAAAVFVWASGTATADLVQIDIFGEVEFNQINSGVFAGVNTATPRTTASRSTRTTSLTAGPSRRAATK